MSLLNYSSLSNEKETQQNKFEEKVQKVTFKKALFNNHILLNEISHRFLVTTKRFIYWVKHPHW